MANAIASLLALAVLASPAKKSWETVVTPDVRAEFLPRSAIVEVDGEKRGRGFVLLKVTDPRRVFQVRSRPRASSSA